MSRQIQISLLTAFLISCVPAMAVSFGPDSEPEKEIQTNIASSERVLTLEECHDLAVTGNLQLEEARQKMKMAELDKKTAVANYFPSISASGTYMYNSHNLNLINDDNASTLSNMGTLIQGGIEGGMQNFMASVLGNKATRDEYLGSPMWQTFVQTLKGTDVSEALNAVGEEICKAFNINITNIYAGVVNLTQPVYVGGKIAASNRLARLAEELSGIQYDEKYQEVLTTVDQAYWQIVSIAAKKKLAQNYVDLLSQMEKDASIAVAEGVAVKSDLLAIKVKHNEANMLLCRADNGLAMSKMLLCKQIGLPLDSNITLADENIDMMSKPQAVPRKDFDLIISDRNEAKMLDLATKIYDQKVNIARSDMLPKLALTANYLVTNPSIYNGINNKFGGIFNAGVLLTVPIFHGTEALQKTRKAKVEAELYKIKYNDACKMINLQVEQTTRQQDEAREKLYMTESNLDSAEENLRTAMVGFAEGVVSSEVTLMAQTAWLQAHSEYIDAGVELQMNRVMLLNAQGEYRKK